jgi:hypothetical protein
MFSYTCESIFFRPFAESGLRFRSDTTDEDKATHVRQWIYYLHASSLQALLESSDRGCHLCSMFWKRLSLAEPNTRQNLDSFYGPPRPIFNISQSQIMLCQWKGEMYGWKPNDPHWRYYPESIFILSGRISTSLNLISNPSKLISDAFKEYKLTHRL